VSEESTGTVLLAGAANLFIAIAKTIGGLASGSTAMLAEAAHSMADTLNQVFLMAAIKRSGKPADSQHPFGYGMERYFWSLLAAVGIFVLGAGYSIYEGVRAIFEPEELTSLVIVYVVLGISFVFEGVSWLRAVRQVRGEARDRGRGAIEHLRTTPDPTVKTVAFEDTAALVGIVLAAIGVTLHAVTDQGFWDGAASVAIGILLIGVAYALGSQNKDFLIGQSVSEDLRRGIREEIEQAPGVDEVVEVLTMRLAPDEVLVAARVDIDDTASGGDLEAHADEVDRRVRERFPEVRHIFLDPTDAPAGRDPEDAEHSPRVS
jgi:cation diffusion facilitator family transporter